MAVKKPASKGSAQAKSRRTVAAPEAPKVPQAKPGDWICVVGPTGKRRMVHKDEVNRQ